MNRQQQIEEMKQWCVENYDKGADTMVECWDDSDYGELLDDAKGNFDYAMEILEGVADVWKDRQDDAENSRF